MVESLHVCPDHANATRTATERVRG
jgi:hypothetical protein